MSVHLSKPGGCDRIKQMKRIVLFIVLSMLIASCKPSGYRGKSEAPAKNQSADLILVLPESLVSRKNELDSMVRYALEQLSAFAVRYGWDSLVREPIMDSVMIFDDKKLFDKTLLILGDADTTMILPDTFCGALEKRTLTVMTPEYYARVYPEGIEKHSYEKLLIHEMAHRLHIRILNGNEEAMGPVWFYEGFAIFAADQFAESNVQLSDSERMEIMNDPERGSYLKYGAIFRYYASKFAVPELVRNAGKTD